MLASFQTNAPQLQVDIDRVKGESMGVSLTDIFETLQQPRLAFTSTISTDLAALVGDGAYDAPFRGAARGYGLQVRNAKGDDPA